MNGPIDWGPSWPFSPEFRREFEIEHERRHRQRSAPAAPPPPRRPTLTDEDMRGLADALGRVIAHERRERDRLLAERDKRIDELERRLAAHGTLADA